MKASLASRARLRAPTEPAEPRPKRQRLGNLTPMNTVRVAKPGARLGSPLGCSAAPPYNVALDRNPRASG